VTGLDAVGSQRYVSLESFRRSGAGVRTPVWFALAHGADGAGRLYVYSTADSGKAKRIRRSGAVRIAPCDMRGTVTGGWVDAHARLVTGEDFNRGVRLLNDKYWPWKSLLDLFSRLRPGANRVMIEIRAV
jgi:uncharacterized protein